MWNACSTLSVVTSGGASLFTYTMCMACRELCPTANSCWPRSSSMPDQSWSAFQASASVGGSPPIDGTTSTW